MSFGFNRKSGNDLPKSPELLPLKEKNFPHSFLLISIRNTALKREQSETRLQEELFVGVKWILVLEKLYSWSG